MEVKKFNLDNIVLNPTFYIIGKRGTGKTYFINDICTKLGYKSIPNQYIVSPINNEYYKNNFKNATIFHKFDEMYTSNPSNLSYQQAHHLYESPTLIILDDCLSSNCSFLNDDNFKNIVSNKNITLFITMQFPLGIPPEFTKQFNYICMFEDNFTNSRKKLREKYTNLNPKEFTAVFEAVTKDQGVMILHNDEIYWYRSTTVTTSQEDQNTIASFFKKICCL